MDNKIRYKVYISDGSYDNMPVIHIKTNMSDNALCGISPDEGYHWYTLLEDRPYIICDNCAKKNND